jgi:hypothetical protein
MCHPALILWWDSPPPKEDLQQPEELAIKPRDFVLRNKRNNNADATKQQQTNSRDGDAETGEPTHVISHDGSKRISQGSRRGRGGGFDD